MQGVNERHRGQRSAIPTAAHRRRREHVLIDALEPRRLLVASPEIILDINTTTAPSYPQHFTTVGTNAYFFANRPDVGYELFKTDGTLAGTTLLKDLRAGPNSS